MISKSSIETINRMYEGKLKITESAVYMDDEFGPFSIHLGNIMVAMILHNLRFEEIIADCLGETPIRNITQST